MTRVFPAERIDGSLPHNGAVIIRVAVPGDAAAIAEIHVRSWQVAYQGLLAHGFLQSLDPTERAERWRESITHQSPPADVTVVLADQDRLIGFTRVCPTRDDDDERTDRVGEVVSIYLRPDTWGQGLGRRLMAQALDMLRRAGNTSATLWVLNGNNRAIRFYEANGWSADGTSKQAIIGEVAVREIRYRIAL
jgi:GNAT superfamily N-acetyltransferase